MRTAIAIDFGTSRTKLAYLDETTGRPELMRLGQRDDPFIPSLFYLERDSERIFLGDDAEAMLEQDPAGIVEVLKRKLHEAYVRANRRRIAPQDLLALLLDDLRTRAGREVTSFGGQPAAVVHLTVPAIYGSAQERILRAAAEQAGFSDIVLVPEPVSAARAWLAQAQTITPGVVVFDGGGGTIDWAYLRRDGTDFSLVPECPPGGDRVGGHDLDRELLARVEDRLDNEALATWKGHEQVALQTVRVIKERYCRGLPCQPVRIGTSEVRLTAAEIDDAFDARFIRHACEGLKGYLAQVRAVSGPDQPPVLLVGGSARIKGLREAIERDCGCETLWWERGDYATVLGAMPERQDRSRVAMSFLIDGIARDVAEAIEADRRGDVDGLAAYLQEHADVRIDLWRAEAEAGLPGAQWILGMCYLWGIGETQDDTQAIAWCRKAAEQGHASAQYDLGEMYRTGWCGVAQDDMQAVAWYRKAAEQGHASAQYTLGWMCMAGQGVTQDDTQAVAWCRKAVEQGHAGAQAKLGEMYQNGWCGVDQDDSQAAIWYRKAAAQGHASAQAMLGAMYTEGRDVTKDDTQAVVWCRKAVEQGHVETQQKLGGDGDTTAAGSFPEKSIATEDVPQHATSALINGRYRDHGDGTVTDVESGLQWMRCSLGQEWKDGTCVGEAKKFAWHAAHEAAAGLNHDGGYAGYRDWRLPTKDELITLVYCSSGRPKTWNDTGQGCKGDFERPTIYQPAFPKTPFFPKTRMDWASVLFWSSSPFAGNSGYAWYVDFAYGNVYYYNKGSTAYVRLLRAGQ